MTRFIVARDDPERADVQTLLHAHLAFAERYTPPGHVYALDVARLLADDVSFYSARESGMLVGVGAIRQLDDSHAELKSIHTAEVHRGRGVARAMVDHLVEVARTRGCTRVSLETGSMPEFAPSRSLYADFGFEQCEPFADYEATANSVCMTMEL